jgi:hypothetical protein
MAPQDHGRKRRCECDLLVGLFYGSRNGRRTGAEGDDDEDTSGHLSNLRLEISNASFSFRANVLPFWGSMQ